MDVRQLMYVEAVARHRHFTRAADELYVAQSALSHQIRRLEAELGTDLFERTSRRVIPTEAGLVIADCARHVRAELDRARDEVDQLRGVLKGRIWIGPLLRAGHLDVPSLLARFSQLHPGIEISLREGLADDMLRYLADHQIDAAFCMITGELPDGVVAERVSEDEIVVAFSPDTAPRDARVDIAELAQRTIVGPRRGSAVTRALEELFMQARTPLHLALESGDPFLLRSLAARGFGAAVLPRSLAQLEGPTVEIRSLDPPISLDVALIWRRSHAPRAAQSFIDFVRQESNQRP
jgi:DNA-binding transcriptional LysR family regulator